jgi:hypothetical protein
MTILELDVIECILNGFGSVEEIVEAVRDTYGFSPKTHVVRGIVSKLAGAGLAFAPGIDRRQ